MDMRPIIKATVQELIHSSRMDGKAHAAEVHGILTRLDIGVRDVELVASDDNIGLRIVMDDGWESLDKSWGPEDSAAALFNAMESQGYRHVPGTSRFLPDGYTRFVKDGMTLDFDPPQLGDWDAESPLQL